MAASLLSFQSIAAGGSVTIPSGSNRLVVITIGGYAWSAIESTGMSLGSATIANGQVVLAKRQQYDTGGNYYVSELLYVKEANIGSGSITLGTPTWSTTIRESPTYLGVYTFDGVDQTTPVDTTAGLGGTSQDAEQSTVAVASGTAQVIHMVTNASAGSATTVYGSGWSEDQDVAGTPGTNGTTRHIDGSKATTTGATIDYGADDTASVRHCIAMASFAPSAGTKYLKALISSSAAGLSGVAGTVFNEPGGSDITGSKIGEFTAQTFLGANSLDGGKAKLLVAVSAFGGSALTTANTPHVYLRTSSFDTQIFPATVIEV